MLLSTKKVTLIYYSLSSIFEQLSSYHGLNCLQKFESKILFPLDLGIAREISTNTLIDQKELSYFAAAGDVGEVGSEGLSFSSSF